MFVLLNYRRGRYLENLTMEKKDLCLIKVYKVKLRIRKLELFNDEVKLDIDEKDGKPRESTKSGFMNAL